MILHRERGTVEELGNPESWLELPKYKRIRKAKPAKLCVTVFGKTLDNASRPSRPLPPQSTSSAPLVSVQTGNHDPISKGMKRGQEQHVEEEKRHKGGQPEEEQRRVGVGDDYDSGFPPKSVAQHGPAFLSLSQMERDWIKRVHHRMGHPDPQRFARFLKDTHAEARIIAGALDYQCGARSESSRGFALARPAAINDKLGLMMLLGPMWLIGRTVLVKSLVEEFGFMRETMC